MESRAIDEPNDRISYSLMEKLSRCEDMRDHLIWEKDYYGEYMQKYSSLNNHLASIDRAILKVENIKMHYEKEL